MTFTIEATTASKVNSETLGMTAHVSPPAEESVVVSTLGCACRTQPEKKSAVLSTHLNTSRNQSEKKQRTLFYSTTSEHLHSYEYNGENVAAVAVPGLETKVGTCVDHQVTDLGQSAESTQLDPLLYLLGPLASRFLLSQGVLAR
jgi:hypothetical protein